MEHHQTNKLVGEVDTGSPTLEAVTNHLVGTVDVTPIEFRYRWNVEGVRRLNTQINSMLDNNVLCDVDVRDLYSIMQELDIHHQWKEMNAKIRAQLEEISKHVDAATQVLDANPPELKPVELKPVYRWNQSWFGPRYVPGFLPGFVLAQPATVATEETTTVEEPATVPEVTPETESVSVQDAVEEEAVIEEEIVEEEEVAVEEDVPAKEEAPIVEEPKVISCTLTEVPWQRWHCQLNRDVANANVDTIIPITLQRVERHLFGDWDEFLADVLDWHRRGLQRYHVRIELN